MTKREIPRVTGGIPAGSFDEGEIAILRVALRYWRAQRAAGHVRRTDPGVTPELVDALIAKLAAPTWAPPEGSGLKTQGLRLSEGSRLRA